MTQLVLPQTIDAGTDITATEHQQNYVAIRDIINGQLEGGSGSSGNFKANGVTAREIADAIFQQGVPGVGDVFQEGALLAADLKVTPGAGLVLNYASGSAWVADDSGIVSSGALLPVVITGSTVTIAANASGNPRIDQIILTLTDFGVGTVSVLQGTASVGATLDNRTGAAALPAGAIRLADILMPNGFAGPFVQATHIRDRRPWARGAHYATMAVYPTATMVAIAVAGTWQALTGDAARRLEIQTGWIEARMQVNMQKNAAGLAYGGLSVFVDGAVNLTGFALTDNATGSSTPVIAATTTVSAASHTFQAMVTSNTTTMNIYQQTLGMSIREVPPPRGENSGA